MVKINDKIYKEIFYSNPLLYNKVKNAKTFLKINFLAIPKYVIEEEVAIIYKIIGTETGEKKQIEILYMAEVTNIESRVIADISDEESQLMGYKGLADYMATIQKHFRITDAQRLCIITEYKKIKNMEDFLE